MYPCFVLAFCVFKKSYYSKVVSPKLQDFKFRHFGHDAVVLHEREILRDIGPFSILRDKALKLDFIRDLTETIVDSNFILISAVINKLRLIQQYKRPEDPYHLALQFRMERLYRLMEEKGQLDKLTHVVVEKRGLFEDQQLELAFRRLCADQNVMKAVMPFEIVFLDKKANSAGLQLSDLVARPIGMHSLNPKGQPCFRCPER